MLILSVGGESIAAPENLQLIRILRALATGVPFTIISDTEDVRDIAAAISIEAQGFINSGMDPWLAHRALSFILNGGSYMPPSAMRRFRTNSDIGNQGAPAINWKVTTRKVMMRNLDR